MILMQLLSKKLLLPKIQPKSKLSAYLTILTLSFTGTGCLSNNSSIDTEHMRSNSKEHFLIGNMSKNENGGVTLLSLDIKNQVFANEGIVAKGKLASYLTLNKDHTSLFTTIADNPGGVNRFKWQAEQQTYALKQTVKIAGKGSCHVAFNKDESQLAIANYSSGDVHLFNVNQDTQYLTEVGYFKNSPSDALKIHQHPRMHYTNWDNSGKYLYAVDLGTDEIKVFNTQKKDFKPTVAANLNNGDGPRHLAFHPHQDVIYVLNEFSSSIVAFTQNTRSGKLHKIQKISALPSGITSKNSASAIRISSDGKYLYAGIRGINVISVFSIDENGQLIKIQSQSSLGNWPRDFNFSANEDYLIVANKREHTVNVLARDKKSGLLSPTNLKVKVDLPSLIAPFNINK